MTVATRRSTASTSTCGPARSSASPGSRATVRTSWSRPSSGCGMPFGGSVTLDGVDITGPSVPRRVRRRGRLRAGRPAPVRAGAVVQHRGQPGPDGLPSAAVRARHPPQRRRDPARGRGAGQGIRHSNDIGGRQGLHVVRRQPAEGGHRAGVRARPEAPRPRPADPRARCRQHRIHPPPGHRQARCWDGDPARLGGAGRGPRAVRSDRRHLPWPSSSRSAMDGRRTRTRSGS